MDTGIAQWLASSYNNKTGDFGFDLKLVQDIKPEFAHQDFIGLVRTILENNERRLSEDSNSTKTTTIHLVRGGKNKAWSIEILRQLESLAREYPTTLYLHVLPSAGHWVHVDDLPGLVELFAKHIDRPNTTISTQQQKQKRNGTGSSRRQFSTLSTTENGVSRCCFSSSSSGKDQHAFFQQQLIELEKERVSLFSSADEEGDSSDVTSTTTITMTNASASNEVFVEQMEEWKSEQKIVFGNELHDHEATTPEPSSSTTSVDGAEENWEDMKEERELLFQFSSEERAAWGDIPGKNSMKELLKEVAKARAAIENKESTGNDKETSSDIVDGSPNVTSLTSSADATKMSVEDHHHESFSHVSEDGKSIHMVDVGHKTVTPRTAHARTSVILPPSVLEAFGLLQNSTGSNANELVGPKGPIFATAKIAGIMAAKNTSNLIPLCHPLPLDQVQIDIRLEEQTGVVTIDCTCKVHHKTGVEMEALTGASVAALTIYDMTKAVSHEICITDTRLVSKTGGKRSIGAEKQD
jgi:cyclic pyranopterin phosphate synthase